MDLSRYTEAELRTLYHRIRDEINKRANEKDAEAAAKWHKGDWVQFKMKKYPFKVVGQIDRINTQVITLINCSDKSPKWHVSPRALEKAVKDELPNV